MSNEYRPELQYRRLWRDTKIAALGGAVLALSVEFSVINSSATEVPAAIGGITLVAGMVAYVIDKFRFRNSNGYSPDPSEPEAIVPEQIAEIIEFQRDNQPKEIFGEAA